MPRKTRPQTVTETLRKAIANSGLSSREIARRCGLDHGRVARFVKGERQVTGRAVDALAKMFGLKLTKERRTKKPPRTSTQKGKG